MRHRRPRHLLLPLLTAALLGIVGLAACTEGGDDASGAEAADTTGIDITPNTDTMTGQDSSGAGTALTTTGDAHTPRRSCSARHFTGEDETERRYSCYEDAPGAWTCSCDGVAATATGPECAPALEAACGVSSVDNWCDHGSTGKCWSDGDDAYRCRCLGAPSIPVAATSCASALFAGCAAPCALDGQGSCTPDFETERFDCACEDGRTALMPPGTPRCDDALGQLCEPACQTSAGVCHGTPEPTAFDCRCAGAADFTRLPFVEIGHDDPCRALSDLCGPPDDAAVTCDQRSSDEVAYGSCRLSAGSYNCQCDNGDGTGGANIGSVGDSTCEALLQAFCPRAFE